MSYIPQFVKGTSTKIQSAIDAGIISYPAYVYQTDTGKLAFIDADNSIKNIVGDNSPSVVNVQELPDPAIANKDCLYIKDNTIYTFDGMNYHASKSEIDASIVNKIDNLEDVLGEDLLSGAISLPEYIKQYVQSSDVVTLEWGEF